MPRSEQITFGPQVCGSLAVDAGGGREWLVTDGLGGFASGTVSGLRTRPSHALLTVGDHAALAALDLTVTLPTGTRITLFTHQWESGAIDPAGHRFLETFTLASGLPRWRWRIGDVVIERELALRNGHPSLAVVHRVVSAPEPVGLAVAAMCTWRETDGVRHASDPPPVAEPVADGVVIEDAYRLAGPGWQPGGFWHLGVRAGDHAEDLWLAGTFFQQTGPGGGMEISAWGGTLSERPPAASVVIAAERERAHRLVTLSKTEGYAETLALSADRFVVRTAEGVDVLAGYPSPEHDPATTMAAYEGLFLDTGRAEEGRELLIRHARARDPQGSPYAPLWLVHAVDRHVTRTGDSDLAARLAVPLARLLRRWIGSFPADGLLQLSPSGKHVDVNALWVNALAAMADLLAEARLDDTEPRALHARARDSFVSRFPAPEGWLHDVVEGPAATYPLGAGAHHDDPTLRPGQLFAWSLPHAPMRGLTGTALRAAGESLLTPLGLRTLAPGEYGYRSTGDGRVLPWLIGAYADACDAIGRPVEGLLTGLEAHLSEWGTGSVSEYADGDAPHHGAGRPFSARSVAEVLRVKQRYTP
ncbi:glycogen debranching enzyme N-terminal domain-containing protein [Actinoplanes sp. NPDC051861]|uniref:glycogen debranching enzyme N-terminal domain-containing protein n=1 Tax=Actinoplanes sp. NPDC051861 TaxID=3155170 RepID=UPI00341F8378